VTVEELEQAFQEFVGKPYGGPSRARDPVNQPMIRHLTDALGDRNPVYTDEEFAAKSVFGGIVAPPTSLQVWTMQGLAGRESARDPDDPQGRLMGLIDGAGYVGVVATNCEQTYHRPLRLGDLLSVTSEVEAISGLKKTALGEGFFITTLQQYRDEDGELVGEMRFRILKFKPGTGTSRPEPQETEHQERTFPPPGFPPPSRDSAFFWDGIEEGELRIQRCGGCGRLRHPPRPMCPHCSSLERDYVVASGRGEVYSFVVHHHPPVPGREHPFVVGLVELEEGTRVVGNVIDVDPAEVHVGLPVEVVFVTRDDGRPLPQWRPR
jgi:uncharacterized protein